jgi:protocatechuate 3,4-dioxygenase beta subunit
VETSVVQLSTPDTPGEPMEARLRFVAATGEPLRELQVYVYHANAAGAYVPARGATGCFRFHGALHGWAGPNAEGMVVVRTIRPGHYPRGSEPAHVHVVVQFPGRRGFYINDVMFEDDARVTSAVRAAQQAPGGSGVVRAVRGAGGVWRVEREIVLQRPTR